MLTHISILFSCILYGELTQRARVKKYRNKCREELKCRYFFSILPADTFLPRCLFSVRFSFCDRQTVYQCKCYKYLSLMNISKKVSEKCIEKNCLSKKLFSPITNPKNTPYKSIEIDTLAVLFLSILLENVWGYFQ